MSKYQKIFAQEIQDLQKKVEESKIPNDLSAKLNKEIMSLQRAVELGNYDEKYEKVNRYINWVLNIPWGQYSEDRLDLQKAKQIFDQHHYGLDEVKNRFLEYISILKLRSKDQANKEFRAPVLLLVGLVGTGKTTFAYALAEALNRKIMRIPFGGMSSSKELRGDSRLVLGSEPGKVIKGLCSAEVMNPVILLDELDRVNQEVNMDIMGVLVELLDPAQNVAFSDVYIDYPVNLGQAIFICTANNTRNIATAVLDRIEKISMPSYSDHEKIVIAKRYILPKLLDRAGLTSQQFVIEEDVWPKVVRPLGYDAGIRTLQRTLEQAVRKVARIIVEQNKPSIIINTENSKEFLPRY